jgi:hypothetical protein
MSRSECTFEVIVVVVSSDFTTAVPVFIHSLNPTVLLSSNLTATVLTRAAIPSAHPSLVNSNHHPGCDLSTLEDFTYINCMSANKLSWQLTSSACPLALNLHAFPPFAERLLHTPGFTLLGTALNLGSGVIWVASFRMQCCLAI